MADAEIPVSPGHVHRSANVFQHWLSECHSRGAKKGLHGFPDDYYAAAKMDEFILSTTF